MPFTPSFSTKIAMMLVKIGDRYWIVIADASDTFWSVTKKKNSAVVPKSPRSSKSQRLEPIQSALARYRPTKQKTDAIEHRKNTTSIAGMCETCLTRIFAKEKASVDKNIERTPSVRNLPLSFNPGSYFKILFWIRNRSPRRSRIFLRTTSFSAKKPQLRTNTRRR